MSKVVLVRPGCTDYDAQNRIQGTLDLPLNERGEQDIQDVLAALEGLNFEAVLTSSVDPARSTAEAIGNHFDVPVKINDGLRNLDHGLWQGLTVDEVRRKYPKVVKLWQDSPETVCPPEGETVTSALHRVQKALEKPLRRLDTFVVVASEPLATLIKCLLKGQKPELIALSRGEHAGPLIEMMTIEGGASLDGGGNLLLTESIVLAGQSVRGENTHEFRSET